MRLLAGLTLLALLALPGFPAAADSGTYEAATAGLRFFIGFPFVTLPLELFSFESLTDDGLPSPDMTGGCDPVLSKGKSGGTCGPADDFEPPGGGGSGGSGGGSGS